MQGRTFTDLARDAHDCLFKEALRYTRNYRDVAVPAQPAKFILAGHQPEMFHPGVWLKNFVLARLAKCQNAVAVNLQIDSDTMKTASLRVPGGSVDQPHMEYVSFDHGAPELPYEQRSILDVKCFESFGERAGSQLGQLLRDPLLQRYWPMGGCASPRDEECWRIAIAGPASMRRGMGIADSGDSAKPSLRSAGRCAGSWRICWRICRGFGRHTIRR